MQWGRIRKQKTQYNTVLSLNTQTRTRNHTNKCALCTHSLAFRSWVPISICPYAFLVWEMCYCQEEPSHSSQWRGIRINLSPLTRGWNQNDRFFSGQVRMGLRQQGAYPWGSDPCTGKGGTTRSLWLLPSLNSGLGFLEHCPQRTSARLKTSRGLILQRALKIWSTFLWTSSLVECLHSFWVRFNFFWEKKSSHSEPKLVKNINVWAVSCTFVQNVCVCMCVSRSFHILMKDLERFRKWIGP